MSVSPALIQELSEDDRRDLAQIDEKIADNQWIRDRVSQLRFKRSTFTEKKAIMMKPYFDKAIKLTQDVLVPSEHFAKYNIDTLYKIVTDSLLYMRVKIPLKHAERYNNLKKKIRIEKHAKGIMLHFVGFHEAPTSSLEEQLERDSSDSLRDEEVVVDGRHIKELPALTAEEITAQRTGELDVDGDRIPVRFYADIVPEITTYMESNSKELKEWKNLRLSADEQKFLVTLFNRIGVSCTVTETMVRIMR